MTANGSVAEMERVRIPLGVDPVFGHQMQLWIPPEKPLAFLRASRLRKGTIHCTCGERYDTPVTNLKEFVHMFEMMTLKHYIDVLVAAQLHGVEAIIWPPPKPAKAPHSGSLSRDSIPDDHDYEADDDFGFPDPDVPIPRRQHPPGTIG